MLILLIKNKNCNFGRETCLVFKVFDFFFVKTTNFKLELYILILFESLKLLIFYTKERYGHFLCFFLFGSLFLRYWSVGMQHYSFTTL